MESKKIGRYFIVRMGRKWFKIDLYEVLKLAVGKSKSELQRLEKQKGLDMYIEINK